MSKRKRLIQRAVAVSAVAILSGCAYTQRQKAEQIEPMLSAAGFKMKLAETPEKLAKIQAMPQLTLRPISRQGKTYYSYADAQGCKCLYLGDTQAFQNYQALVESQREARQDKEAAVVNEDAGIVEDDAMWEDWGYDVW